MARFTKIASNPILFLGIIINIAVATRIVLGNRYPPGEFDLLALLLMFPGNLVAGYALPDSPSGLAYLTIAIPVNILFFGILGVLSQWVHSSDRIRRHIAVAVLSPFILLGICAIAISVWGLS